MVGRDGVARIGMGGTGRDKPVPYGALFHSCGSRSGHSLGAIVGATLVVARIAFAGGTGRDKPVPYDALFLGRLVAISKAL